MGTRARRLTQAFGPLRWAALAFLLALAAAALIGPFLLPDPLAQNVTSARLPLGAPGHPLGTDDLGRDVLSRLLHGARTELVIALGATLTAMTLGTTLGLLGGYFRGPVEMATMRVVTDVLLCFPPVILALLVVTIYGPGTATLICVMGVLYAPTFARIAFGQALTVRRMEYVDAARAYGAPVTTTLGRVVLPNIASPIIVQGSLIMAASILLESGLSYLGLGVPAPAPSWGSMVASGQRFMASDPTLIAVPGAVIVLTILSFSLLGDALRDWLDPRGKARHA